MDFLNDLGKKFTKAASRVQAFTRDGVESTRLNADLRDARSELETHYAELGKAYYESLGTADGEIPAALIDRIRACLEHIEELTAQRDRRVRCPGCGSVQDAEARYCSNCGKRMPEDLPLPAAEPEEDDAEYCPECGAMRREGDDYCAVCSHSFVREAAALSAAPTPKPAADRPAPLEEPEHFGE